jgi:hypothetical protein
LPTGTAATVVATVAVTAVGDADTLAQEVADFVARALAARAAAAVVAALGSAAHGFRHAELRFRTLESWGALAAGPATAIVAAGSPGTVGCALRGLANPRCSVATGAIGAHAAGAAAAVCAATLAVAIRLACGRVQLRKIGREQ